MIENILEILEEEVKPLIDIYVYLDLKEFIETLETDLTVVDYRYFYGIEHSKDQTLYAVVYKLKNKIVFMGDFKYLTKFQRRQVKEKVLEVIDEKIRN